MPVDVKEQELEDRIAILEKEVNSVKKELENLRNTTHMELPVTRQGLPFPLQDYRRYGRQMVLDAFGLPAQIKLRDASVIVIGAGGLGCPAIQYLAATGVGKLGIIDNDIVELSNLQRQILHCDATIGWPKVSSAKLEAERINPRISVATRQCLLDSANAKDILSGYDIILDCTDNLPTRYLLSDVAVHLGKPLVSGAALKFDGQLCVYNLGEDGPCYRCLFPKPSPREGEGTCEDVGVLGVVTGVIGTLQAMEAIKLLTNLHDKVPSLLIFSALATPQFRSVKLRSKRPGCIACGANPLDLGANNLEADYVAFCGGERPNLVQTGAIVNDLRIKAKDLFNVISHNKESTTVLDVRTAAEFTICHIPGSINISMTDLTRQ
ncbi:Urmylation protein [Tulasnella sp. 331]|nr:Urmylation protein [Tulasnella sp. 331]